MVELNLHVLYPGLTMVHTLRVLYIWQQNVEFVFRYDSRQVLFFAYCVYVCIWDPIGCYFYCNVTFFLVGLKMAGHTETCRQI